MEKTDFSERRCGERVILSIPEALSIHGLDGAYMVGISGRGAEIACLQKPNLSAAVPFCLDLPQGMYRLATPAKVVWQKREKAWHLGLTFDHLSDLDKQVLEAYVDYLKRDNKLLEARKSINMHLEAFIRNFERLLELKGYLVSRLSKEQVAHPEPQSGYLH
ncbi:MAG: PilZ domain-containing protein [Pseudomonadota bacterium]